MNEGLPFERLGSHESKCLQLPFLSEEVEVALSDLSKEKTPCLDDFTIAFWLFSWDFMEEEVMGFFKDFYESVIFLKAIPCFWCSKERLS